MIRFRERSQKRRRPWRMVSLIGGCLSGGMIVLTGCGPSTSQSATSTSTGKNQTTNVTRDVTKNVAANSTSSANNSLLHVTSVDMVSQNDGWATGTVGSQLALWRSHDNGLVWSRVALPYKTITKGTNGFPMSFSGTNSLFLAKETKNGVQTYVTRNGGKSWNRRGLAPTSDTMVQYFHFTTSTNGWMTGEGYVTGHGFLMRSSDGGKVLDCIQTYQTG